MDEPATFFSAPLEHQTEITSSLEAHLSTSFSTAEADLFVTVQAFSPDGREVVFWLRGFHRKLDTVLDKPDRPYHSHDERWPLTHGDLRARHGDLAYGHRLACGLQSRGPDQWA